MEKSRQETIPSAALLGLDVYRVRVEVAITRGTPMIQMVGLPHSAVREGKERIRAAANQLGLHLPGLRITVNLAPAAVRKSGAAFDLPILVGILAAWGDLPAERCRRWAMVGELGLDGSVRPVRGALPVALHAMEEGDVEGLILPRANLAEARPAAGGLRVRGASDLEEVVGFLEGDAALPGPDDVPDRGPDASDADPDPDLSDVYGQERVKRALEVAAAGGHNVLLRGEPGAGKTMLARRLPGLLPSLTLPEAVEVTAVHSVAGRLGSGEGLIRRRPFRSPHHTVSRAGLVGGGAIPRPGEVSLAHHGVLFLDELAEFGRSSLEALRQPVEEGEVTLVRARAAVSYPARFLLVAAMNPCPCGYHTSRSEHRCTCGPSEVTSYAGRVSGPVMDRIDLHVDVPALAWEELREGRRGEATAEVRARVVEARRRAARRLAGARGLGAERARRAAARIRATPAGVRAGDGATGAVASGRAGIAAGNGGPAPGGAGRETSDDGTAASVGESAGRGRHEEAGDDAGEPPDEAPPDGAPPDGAAPDDARAAGAEARSADGRGKDAGPGDASAGHGDAARRRRIVPLGDGAPALVNARLTVPEIERFCALDPVGESLLRRAVQKHALSARAYHRILRLARTVADLAGSRDVEAAHVAEAAGYRVLDRQAD